MTESEPYWGRRALDFVDAIEASKTTASVISQFEKMIGEGLITDDSTLAAYALLLISER